nr:Fic family protein [Brucella anthropi]
MGNLPNVGVEGVAVNIFRNEIIENEYNRWKKHLPSCEYVGGLSYDDVLTVHFVLVDMFYSLDSGIGGIGPKSIDLLISAVSRQYVSFGGTDKWSKPEEIAATLLYGIVLNHPFHDANKRTGFLSTLLLLNRFNITIKITEKQFEDFVVTVADKSFRKFEKYKRTFADQDDADIRYIAHHIRLCTRKSDKKDYIVTYRELNTLLRRFGYTLSNPHANTIDVIEIKTGVRICNIGYHSHSRQVAKPVIKYVRQETGLDFLRGCDSGAFFNGEEPINNLLAKYYEPLERLAYR